MFASLYNIAMKISMHNVFHTQFLLISYTHRIQNNLNALLDCIKILTVHIVFRSREYPFYIINFCLLFCYRNCSREQCIVIAADCDMRTIIHNGVNVQRVGRGRGQIHRYTKF